MGHLLVSAAAGKAVLDNHFRACNRGLHAGGYFQDLAGESDEVVRYRLRTLHGDIDLMPARSLNDAVWLLVMRRESTM